MVYLSSIEKGRALCAARRVLSIQISPLAEVVGGLNLERRP